MLSFGFFEDFKGRDTLLIWGDAQGVSCLQELFTRLSTGTASRAGIDMMAGARGMPGVAVTFELGTDELHIERSDNGVAIVGRYPAARFAEFADKISALVHSQSGHHYLDWRGMTDIQIIVSKSEYGPDFGTGSVNRTP